MAASLPPFLRQSKSDLHTTFTDLEWAQRNRLLTGTQPPSSQDPSDPSNQFSRLPPDLVASRNRYLNVEPYAQNRVRLKVPQGKNDYINASPIQLGSRKYIATQGPKGPQIGHFWRMVEETGMGERVVVVMLTQTHEAGREKCAQYFPLDEAESPLKVEEDLETGDGWQAEVHLEGMEEDEGSRSQMRRLRLRTWFQDEGESEVRETEVVHLLFSGWPDFLVPEGEDKTGLVELVRLSATLNQPNGNAQSNGTNGITNSIHTFADTSSTPRIIHCSAGVGRSGTFIALDHLLTELYAGNMNSENLDPADKDPIAETVDLLRQQRMMMVQGESQFGFLYDVLKEWFVHVQGEGHTDGGAADRTD